MAKKKTKFSFINEVHENLTQVCNRYRKGRRFALKRADVRLILENAFTAGR